MPSKVFRSHYNPKTKLEYVSDILSGLNLQRYDAVVPNSQEGSQRAQPPQNTPSPAYKQPTPSSTPKYPQESVVEGRDPHIVTPVPQDMYDMSLKDYETVMVDRKYWATDLAQRLPQRYGAVEHGYHGGDHTEDSTFVLIKRGVSLEHLDDEFVLPGEDEVESGGEFEWTEAVWLRERRQYKSKNVLWIMLGIQFASADHPFVPVAIFTRAAGPVRINLPISSKLYVHPSKTYGSLFRYCEACQPSKRHYFTDSDLQVRIPDPILDRPGIDPSKMPNKYKDARVYHFSSAVRCECHQKNPPTEIQTIPHWKWAIGGVISEGMIRNSDLADKPPNRCPDTQLRDEL
eukprot:gene8241-391_t